MVAKPTYEELQYRIKELECDFPKRKRIEDDLERLFKLSPDIIGSGTLDGYFSKINSVIKKILGYSESEFCKNHSLLLFIKMMLIKP